MAYQMSAGEMTTAFYHTPESEDDAIVPISLICAYLSIIAFNLSITIPVALYFCIRIMHPVNNQIFHKRYPRLTNATVSSFLIIHLLLKPICDLPKFLDWDTGFDPKYLYPYFGYLPWALILVRGWYLFYDYKHGMHLVQSEWSSKLKESRLNVVDVVPASKHWTLRYQAFLSGNSSFPIYFVLFWVVLADVLCLVLMTYDYRVSDMVYASFRFVIFRYILWYKNN